MRLVPNEEVVEEGKYQLQTSWQTSMQLFRRCGAIVTELTRVMESTRDEAYTGSPESTHVTFSR
jgi:hypothetical protein